jgi:hypothetical protein
MQGEQSVRTHFVSPGLLVVLAAFIISRIVFDRAGIRFDAANLNTWWHFIDPALLRTRLLESLWYLHTQPPLFNLFLGLVLKASGQYYPAVFSAVYQLLGLVLGVGLLRLMIRLGVAEWLATTFTVVFIVSPACILYENWLFYTFPLCVMLVISALYLERWLTRERGVDLVLFFVLLSLLALTRNLFHLFWLVFIAGALLLLRRAHWKQIIFSAAISVLLVLGLYVKNQVLFDSFTSSTWLGMSLARFTTLALPPEEQERLVASGEITRLSTIKTFQPLDSYRLWLKPVSKTGIPVLDQEVKPSGEPNFNSPAYLQVDRQYLKDALHIIRTRPEVYFSHLLNSWGTFFESSTNFLYVQENRQRIGEWDRFYNLVFVGSLSEWLGSGSDRLYRFLHRFGLEGIMGPTAQEKFGHIGVLVLVGFLLAAVFGLVFSLRGLRPGRDRARGMALLYVWFNLVYVAVVTNALERRESNRIRFMIDPFLLVIVAVVLDRLFRRARPQRADSPPVSAAS